MAANADAIDVSVALRLALSLEGSSNKSPNKHRRRKDLIRWSGGGCYGFEEANASCFIVKDNNGQALAYVYFEQDPGRRTAANSAYPRRGPPDRGQYCEAARAIETTVVLSGPHETGQVC